MINAVSSLSEVIENTPNYALIIKALNINEIRLLEATSIDKLDLKPKCSLTNILIFMSSMCVRCTNHG
jgi:hypothetical protein